MAYITLNQYVEYLGQPDFSTTDFMLYVNVASDLIDQLTHYAIPRIGFANLPLQIQTMIQKATAMQTLYVYNQGGLSALGDESAGGFTVGKVSVSAGGNSSLTATRGSTAISPMTISLLEQTGLMNPSVPLGRWSIC